MNKVALGKQHRKIVSKNDNQFDLASCGNAIFDANTKTASGMIYAGIGVTHLNNFLSTLNLPQICHKSLKVREVEIGSVMQSFANKSIDAALVREQEITQKELNTEGPVGIEVSSDAAWQKRGSQRSYNSLSGIASAIGKKTKKIVHFNSRFKKCCISVGMHQNTTNLCNSINVS